MADTKRCVGCGEEKPLTEFNRRRLNRDGLEKKCRACLNKIRTDRERRMAEAGNPRSIRMMLVTNEMCETSRGRWAQLRVPCRWRAGESCGRRPGRCAWMRCAWVPMWLHKHARKVARGRA